MAKRRSMFLSAVFAASVFICSCGSQVDHGQVLDDSCVDDPTTGGSFWVTIYEDGHVSGHDESGTPC